MTYIMRSKMLTVSHKSIIIQGKKIKFQVIKINFFSNEYFKAISLRSYFNYRSNIFERKLKDLTIFTFDYFHIDIRSNFTKSLPVIKTSTMLFLALIMNAEKLMSIKISNF